MTLPVHNPEIPVCRRLRTKQYFMHATADTPWHEGKSNTAAFWCLRTMGAAGPDEAFVHPKDCRPGRSCYEVAQ